MKKMMKKAILVVLTAFSLARTDARLQANIDPCNPQNHRELNEPYRSTGYILSDRGQPLCDDDLKSGWYRFTSQAGGEMPTVCPQKRQCGTLVPLWMKGAHPAPGDGIVQRVVCGNYVLAGNCCDHSFPISVKNCGSYYVYLLQPTSSCPASYCAGTRKPCPYGKWSPTMFPPCKDGFPWLTTPPVLTGPDVRNNRFVCNITFAPQNLDQAFEVVWTFDGKENPAIPAKVLTGNEREATLDGSALAGFLDTNVGCRVRSYFIGNEAMKSPFLDSNRIFAENQVTLLHNLNQLMTQLSRNPAATKLGPASCSSSESTRLSVQLRRVLRGVKNLKESMHTLETSFLELAKNVDVNMIDIKNTMSVFSRSFDKFQKCCTHEGDAKVEKNSDDNTVSEDAKAAVDFISNNNVLIFNGIKEIDGENTEAVLRIFLAKYLGVVHQVPQFSKVIRLGEQNPTANRPILARFKYYKDREDIRRKSHVLCSSPFSVSEQYPEEWIKKRKILSPLMFEEIANGKPVYLYQDVLFVDNERFYVDSDGKIQQDERCLPVPSSDTDPYQETNIDFDMVTNPAPLRFSLKKSTVTQSQSPQSTTKTNDNTNTGDDEDPFKNGIIQIPAPN